MDIKIGDKKFKFKDRLIMRDYLKQIAKTDPQRHDALLSSINLISSASIDGKFNLETIKQLDFTEGMELLTKVQKKFGLMDKLNFLADESND
jgi:hypothetical protein